MEVRSWPDQTSAKLSVHELPQIWAPIPADGGILVSEAGRFARVLDGEVFRSLAHVEFLPGRTRGNHYHLAKRELLYITDGRLLAYYVDIDTGRSLELTLGAGHVVRTGPRLAHAYQALEVAHAIEISVQPFDASDTVPYEVYPISDDPRIGREGGELARELQLKDRIDASHGQAPVVSAEPAAVSGTGPGDGRGPVAPPARGPQSVSGAAPSPGQQHAGHVQDQVPMAPPGDETDRTRRRGGAR